ncbi:ABC transporter permease [Amedibacillus sp. YH-ame10]
MKSFMTMLKIETKVALRCPDGLIFGVGMPIGILLLIAVIGGDSFVGNSKITFMQSAFASLLTVGICATAFMGLPLTVADLRDKKILKHFFVTPASPLRILLVQVIICVGIAILSAILVSLCAVFGFQYEMLGNVFVFIGAYILVMCSMFALGMMIASLCKTVKIANVVTTFVYFPMVFLSGATIPFELFPKALQNVASVLPLTHGIKLLKEVSLGNLEQLWLSVGILLIFTVVGVILSVVSFKWE